MHGVPVSPCVVSTALSKICEGYRVLLSQWDADRFAKQDMVNPVGVGMIRLRAAELENVMNMHLTSACIVILTGCKGIGFLEYRASVTSF